MKRSTILTSILLVSALAGYIVGRICSIHDIESTGWSPPFENSHVHGNVSATRQVKASRQLGRWPSSSSASDVDTATRIREIFDHANQFERAEAWAEFLGNMQPEEFQDAAIYFDDAWLPGLIYSEYASILEKWAELDPHAAIEFTRADYYRNEELQIVLAAWSRNEPLSAMQWLERQAGNSDVNRMMVGIIQGIAANDSRQANELLAVMPDSKERMDAMNALKDHYLHQGHEAARIWALGLKDPQLRSSAIASVASSISSVDPVGAANWLLKNQSEGSTQVMKVVMSRMAEGDSAYAIAYFDGIRESQAKSHALMGLTEHFADHAPQLAYKLIESNPSSITDEVIQKFVWSARAQSPALAAKAITRLQDPETKSLILMRYFKRDVDLDLAARIKLAAEMESLSFQELQMIEAILNDEQLEQKP